MKNIDDLKLELSTYNNIRKVIGEIEIKVHSLYKNNEDYWNIMINNFDKDISVRWHVKQQDCSFEQMVNIYFIPLVDYFKSNNDIFEIFALLSLLQKELNNKNIK